MSPPTPNPLPGRGTAANPTGRFERLHYEADPEAVIEEMNDGDYSSRPSSPRTQFFRDDTQTILAHNDSPDVGFDTSLNPYRGCEHGCIYCFARPTHEFLGWSAGLDFETKIMVKPDAATLLRRELENPRWQPRVVALSGVTDCYQPAERRLRITRRCLEVFVEFRNPVGIVTKNHGVTRDLDLLAELARHRAVAVFLSVTPHDPNVAKIMEPRARPPTRRLAAIRELSAAGIPVGVLTAPIIPGLNDHEVPAILQAAAEAGARCASYTLLRLPYGLKSLFESWLDAHFHPQKKEKILSRLRTLRDGQLNRSDFGMRMTGTGPAADEIRALFRVARRRAGIPERGPELSTAAFRRREAQLNLSL